jgi:hypothetical protein
MIPDWKMIPVGAEPLSMIEQWPLAEAGLSARIVNACSADGIERLGELRQASPSRLLKLPHFGRKSLEHCHRFQESCHELAAGSLQIRSLREWMETFISPDGYEVISSRYGFFRADLGAGRKFFTLQDIANRTGRSRERIRQVEESSIAMLAKKLPRSGLRAAALALSTWLETQDDSADWAAFQTLSGWKEWDGASPAALAFYLGELFPTILTIREDYASRIPPDKLQNYRAAALSRIKTLNQPVSLTELIESIRKEFPETSKACLEKLLQLELQHASDLICTVNGQCCGPRSLCLAHLLRNQLRGLEQPVHFRELARLVNQQLTPAQAAGAGTVLRCLTHRDFRRRDFGLYSMSSAG